MGTTLVIKENGSEKYTFNNCIIGDTADATLLPAIVGGARRIVWKMYSDQPENKITALLLGGIPTQPD